MRICELEKVPCWHPDLGLKVSGTVNNKFLFISYRICSIFLIIAWRSKITLYVLILSYSFYIILYDSLTCLLWPNSHLFSVCFLNIASAFLSQCLSLHILIFIVEMLSILWKERFLSITLKAENIWQRSCINT